ncbi:hypothetical protein PIB30_070546 [Stylosanthes scabra]|uniref:Alpha/beta hydrolase fold-3 domain-containing protein n=1 Tax=Stylosanthes scabra TaxID=79078 RepID=A0ABU6WPI1_9FABA|nr:hypothetical protein [Stylosanthes scabra]
MSERSEEQHMKIVKKPDGTVTLLRKPEPGSLPQSDPTLSITVLSKDHTINPHNNTWLRLFLPKQTITDNNSKLPLIVFFHASGFVTSSAASTLFHDFCEKIAEDAAAVVASVEYRLAPEHRLPAAYDDAVEALHWIKASKEEWLTKHVDYSRCYLMGNSAGATIAYYAGLRVAAGEAGDLEPLKIQGLILRHPYIGGTKRSESELRLENDAVLPLSLSDMMWELALPFGADRDHEYCNLTGMDDWRVEKVRDQGWRVMVSGSGGDPLVDRDRELVKLLEEKGVCVVSEFENEGSHCIELTDPNKAKSLIRLVKHFISS